jgi:hypothetical protein
MNATSNNSGFLSKVTNGISSIFSSKNNTRKNNNAAMPQQNVAPVQAPATIGGRRKTRKAVRKHKKAHKKSMKRSVRKHKKATRKH